MKDKARHVPKTIRILGILTIEDVIECLINEDIMDETDISFAVHEFQEDMKGVRKAVAKFKSLLKKNKKKNAKSEDDQMTRKRMARSNIKRLVSDVRARMIAKAASVKEGKTPRPQDQKTPNRDSFRDIASDTYETGPGERRLTSLEMLKGEPNSDAVYDLENANIPLQNPVASSYCLELSGRESAEKECKNDDIRQPLLRESKNVK